MRCRLPVYMFKVVVKILWTFYVLAVQLEVAVQIKV